MSKMIVCSIAAFFFVIFSLFSAPSKMCLGKDMYGTEVLESLEVFGTVKLNGTTVLKSTRVTGNLIAESARLNTVEANGEIRLCDTVIEQASQVTGFLKSERTIFQKPLIFSGQKGVFSACQLSDLTIQRDGAFKAKQIIELKKKTRIDGFVTFEGGGGEIHLYPGSKIYGPVSGGKIVYKNP